MDGCWSVLVLLISIAQFYWSSLAKTLALRVATLSKRRHCKRGLKLSGSRGK